MCVTPLPLNNTRLIPHLSCDPPPQNAHTTPPSHSQYSNGVNTSLHPLLHCTSVYTHTCITVLSKVHAPLPPTPTCREGTAAHVCGVRGHLGSLLADSSPAGEPEHATCRVQGVHSNTVGFCQKKARQNIWYYFGAGSQLIASWRVWACDLQGSGEAQ
jgi:hypothetical protein